MAQRRMVSNKIIDTDNFLSMPISTRLLYYDYCMRADDDGFIDNPKKIIKMIGASDDDLKLLIAKKYVIAFETGVCVITHWRIHNYIQKDRYNATEYKTERSLLNLKDNKYVLNDTTSIENKECIQNVSNLDTQVRLELGYSKSEVNITTTNNILNIFEYVEKSFKRTLSSLEIKDLDELSQNTPADILKYAIDISCVKNKKFLAYTVGILERWKSQNLTTIDLIKKNEEEYKTKSKHNTLDVLENVEGEIKDK